MENDFHEARLSGIEQKVLELRERGIPRKWIAKMLQIPWAAVIAITNSKHEGESANAGS